MTQVREYTEEELRDLPHYNMDLSTEDRVAELLERMTIAEKFELLSGEDMWSTTSIDRLGIPSFKMSDGPHGFRNATSTYFPIAKCRASSWNPGLSNRFGKALAEEVRANDYHMILGPGINIDRTPLNGRTFEYLTEDPFLNGRLAVATVNGIQNQRIAACAKHYIANNQETERRRVSANVSERALREIYLPGFKSVVEEAQVWSIMTSYNRTNGQYGCAHKDLLINKLREEFGFEGFIVTDWWATADIDGEITADCINNGLNLEMPGIPGGVNKPAIVQYRKDQLQDALSSGEISIDTINLRIREILRIMFRVGIFDDPSTLPLGETNTPSHQLLAREIAEEGIVLLKNDGNLLPLDIEKISTLTVLGPNSNVKHASGGGSAMLEPPYEITPLQGIQEYCEDRVKIKTEMQDVQDSDAVLLFVGLNHDPGNDTESHDRKSLDLPQDQIDLINECLGKNDRTIVVLINGSPVSLENVDEIPALVEAWYPGQEGGRAIANILFGKINPSGKLTITFPKTLSDSPAHQSDKTFPGVGLEVDYEEGIFVGYRHFDRHEIEPLFPFGHGLSYSEFSYSNLEINQQSFSKDGEIKVCFDLENTGDRRGAEVVQLYVTEVNPTVERPIKELKGFQKVILNAGQKKKVSICLKAFDLAYYDEQRKTWILNAGNYEVQIGSSSRDIRLTQIIEIL